MLAAMFNDDSNIGGGKGIFCIDDLEKICDDAIEQLKKEKIKMLKITLQRCLVVRTKMKQS